MNYVLGAWYFAFSGILSRVQLDTLKQLFSKAPFSWKRLNPNKAGLFKKNLSNINITLYNC